MNDTERSSVEQKNCITHWFSLLRMQNPVVNAIG